MPTTSTDIIRGTADLLILKLLEIEPMHGWGIAQRIHQLSREALPHPTRRPLRRPPPNLAKGLDQIAMAHHGERPTRQYYMLTAAERSVSPMRPKPGIDSPAASRSSLSTR